MSIRLRAATTADAPTSREIHREASLAAFPHISPPGEYPLPSEGVLRRWQDEVLRGLRELSPSVCRLWVLAENHRARRFYERRAGGRMDGGRGRRTHRDLSSWATRWIPPAPSPQNRPPRRSGARRDRPLLALALLALLFLAFFLGARTARARR